MSVDITVQFAIGRTGLPHAAAIRCWVRAALQNRQEAQLTVRIVDETEGAELNRYWRGKQGPTNVLSFPCEGLEQVAPGLLGDIVVCAPVVAREAQEQDKELRAHWAHMLIHATLHLLGHDHQAPAETAQMEKLETDILANLGYADPYAVMD